MPPRGGFIREPTSTPVTSVPSVPASTPLLPTHLSSPPKPARPLTGVQERRLIDYLDEHILAVSRQVKRRNAAQSRIPDLPAMTEQIRPLLTVVLSIPPFSTSAALRSSYLLRLTGDVQEGVAIFGLSDYQFAALSEFFDLLDRGWHCCLSGHVWDSAAQTGVPVAVDSDFDNADGHTPPSAPRGVPSTDRVRLSSLLLNLRESLRQALALPDGDEPSEGTPALVSDISTEATSEAQSSRRSTSVATGDGAAAMDMVLDPDADDSDDEDQAGIASAIPVDDPTAGELEESIQRLFGRSFALLSEL